MIFPKNPVDGQIERNEVGQHYKYIAATNSWSQVTVSSLPLAQDDLDGIMSSDDFRKLSEMRIPPLPPINLIVACGGDTVNYGALGGILRITGDEIIEVKYSGMANSTATLDFGINIEKLAEELIQAGRMQLTLPEGDMGDQGEKGTDGLDGLAVGPYGPTGADGKAVSWTGELVRDVLDTNSDGRVVVDISVSEIDDKSYLVVNRAMPGNSASCPNTMKIRGVESPLAITLGASRSRVAVSNVENSDACNNTMSAALCNSIGHINMNEIADVVYNRWKSVVANLKAAKENATRHILEDMEKNFSSQKAALCCAIEACKSRTRNQETRRYLEQTRLAAAAQNKKIVIGGESDKVYTRDSRYNIDGANLNVLSLVDAGQSLGLLSANNTMGSSRSLVGLPPQPSNPPLPSTGLVPAATNTPTTTSVAPNAASERYMFTWISSLVPRLSIDVDGTNCRDLCWLNAAKTTDVDWLITPQLISTPVCERGYWDWKSDSIFNRCMIINCAEDQRFIERDELLLHTLSIGHDNGVRTEALNGLIYFDEIDNIRAKVGETITFVVQLNRRANGAVIPEIRSHKLPPGAVATLDRTRRQVRFTWTPTNEQVGLFTPMFDAMMINNNPAWVVDGVYTATIRVYINVESEQITDVSALSHAPLLGATYHENDDAYYSHAYLNSSAYFKVPAIGQYSQVALIIRMNQPSSFAPNITIYNDIGEKIGEIVPSQHIYDESLGEHEAIYNAEIVGQFIIVKVDSPTTFGWYNVYAKLRRQESSYTSTVTIGDDSFALPQPDGYVLSNIPDLRRYLIEVLNFMPGRIIFIPEYSEESPLGISTSSESLRRRLMLNNTARGDVYILSSGWTVVLSEAQDVLVLGLPGSNAAATVEAYDCRDITVCNFTGRITMVGCTKCHVSHVKLNSLTIRQGNDINIDRCNSNTMEFVTTGGIIFDGLRVSNCDIHDGNGIRLTGEFRNVVLSNSYIRFNTNAIVFDQRVSGAKVVGNLIYGNSGTPVIMRTQPAAGNSSGPSQQSNNLFVNNTIWSNVESIPLIAFSNTNRVVYPMNNKFVNNILVSGGGPIFSYSNVFWEHTVDNMLGDRLDGNVRTIAGQQINHNLFYGSSVIFDIGELFEWSNVNGLVELGNIWGDPQFAGVFVDENGPKYNFNILDTSPAAYAGMFEESPTCDIVGSMRSIPNIGAYLTAITPCDYVVQSGFDTCDCNVVIASSCDCGFSDNNFDCTLNFINDSSGSYWRGEVLNSNGVVFTLTIEKYPQSNGLWYFTATIGETCQSAYDAILRCLDGIPSGSFISNLVYSYAGSDGSVCGTLTISFA